MVSSSDPEQSSVPPAVPQGQQRAPPWQYLWKRPRVHPVNDNCTFAAQPQSCPPPLSTTATDVAPDGRCLGMSSAHILADECHDEWLADQLRDPQDLHGLGSLVLTVTVVDTSASRGGHVSATTNTTICGAVGDVIVLQVVRYPGPVVGNGDGSDDENEYELKEQEEKAEDKEKEPTTGTPERLFTRVLQWPGVALREPESATSSSSWRSRLPTWLGGILEEDGNTAESEAATNTEQQQVHQEDPPPFTTTKTSRNGVVSACLCRRRVVPPEQTAAMDALDAMTFLSLGLGPEVATTNNATSTADSSNHHQDDREELQNTADAAELVLACLCNNGTVHIYSPWKLLASSKRQQQQQDDHKDPEEDVFGLGMSSFLLGSAVVEQLQQRMWPLSQPEASLTISTVPFMRQKRTYHTSSHTTDKVHHEERGGGGATASVGAVSAPDGASISSSSYDMDDNKSLGIMSTMSGDQYQHAFEIPEQDLEFDQDDEQLGNKMPLWDRAVWDATVDPASAMYRTYDNIPTHCTAAFDFLAIAGRGTRRTRRRRHHRQQEGGFVTMISLHKYAEVRTLFLPFRPRDISPLVWGGMEFLLVVGENCVAVAIRLDLSMQHTVVCGEPPRSNTIKSNDTAGPAGASANLARIRSESSLVSLLSTKSNNSDQSSSHNRAQSPLTITSNPYTKKKKKKPLCHIHRFQILPILVPRILTEDAQPVAAASSLMVGSMDSTEPPGLALVCPTTNSSGDGSNRPQQDLLVLRRTFVAVDYWRTQEVVVNTTIRGLFQGYRQSKDRRMLGIGTSQEPRHVARIAPPPTTATTTAIPRALAHWQDSCWCHLAQGWCLLGVSKRAYFICWEGANSSRGAYVNELTNLKAPSSSRDSPPLGGMVSRIIPIDAMSGGEQMLTKYSASYKMLQQLNLVQSFMPHDASAVPGYGHAMLDKSSGMSESLKTNSSEDETMDRVVSNAIRSISMRDYKDNVAARSPPTSPDRNRKRYSHSERSVRLLQQCGSWAQLNESKQKRILLDVQFPVLTILLQSNALSLSILSLRRMGVFHGVATPFYEVLSWLSNRNDYFTAASVALDLLCDAKTLRHLWRSFERIDEDDEQSKLEGLLDGVIPIRGVTMVAAKADPFIQPTLTQLADMTIGCFTKGGFAMASTLEHFLREDPNYNTSRTCIMLVATAARTLSNEQAAVEAAMGDGYLIGDADPKSHVENILWPVRCLLQVGVARDNLASALELINAAVPDELRRRQPTEDRSMSMHLCQSLVTLIVASAPEATDILLGLVDEQGRERYWQSLQHETQTKLALTRIDDKYPLLCQIEVRFWALQYLSSLLREQRCVGRSQNDDDGCNQVGWLRRLCKACFVNAGCDLTVLRSLKTQRKESDSAGDDDDDGLEAREEEVLLERKALMASPGSGGLDLGLVIPSLLLLELSEVHWSKPESPCCVSTQSLLDACCDVAGRALMEEPLFPLDSSTLMKQCTLANNVSAAAYLVGGKNGLILSGCATLTKYCGMTMEEAEEFLCRDILKAPACLAKPKVSPSSSETWFQLTGGHRLALWLLDQHVLQIRTYGELQGTPTRGRVDPVFAAQVCLRTWYALNISQIPKASSWLVTWFRRRLQMTDTDGVSKKRLACAALSRALLWSRAGEVLAEHLQLESNFLVQLTQSCWMVVDSVPPSIADEILQEDFADNGGLKRASTGRARISSHG